MIGKKLGGRYEILSLIGEGGMASAYSARDNLLNRIVAVKVLKGHLSGDEDFVRRFRREAQAAAGLIHPNIVNVFDVGKDNGNHYMVIEYVEGYTLKAMIREEGSLDPEKAVDIIIQIAEAIQHAHSSHVIHRDIKPQNILISTNGQVKVADFGIAMAANASQTITCGETIMGSVHYFSPEQARGGIVGEQSDIYSLGIVLYEMLSGKVPFSGESPISVALKHVNEEITPLREIVPQIPEALEKIVLKTAQKEASLRYSSVRELIEDLKLWQEEKRVYHAISSDENFEATRAINPVKVEEFNEEESNENEIDSKRQRVKSSNTNSAKKPNQNRSSSQKGLSKKKSFWKSAWLISLIVVVILLGILLGGVLALWRSVGNVPEIVVPELVGMTLEEAEDKLNQEGLENINIDEDFHDEIEEGRVISQSPSANSSVRENREITLVISEGVERIEIPDLTGKTHLEARPILASKRLEFEVIEESHEEIPDGYIIRQEPEEGSKVTREDKITIYVSVGPPPMSLADLGGKTKQEAREYLVEHGLLGEENMEHSEHPEGTVIEHNPEPGTPVKRGETVSLIISKGPEKDEEEEEEEEEEENNLSNDAPEEESEEEVND